MVAPLAAARRHTHRPSFVARPEAGAPVPSNTVAPLVIGHCDQAIKELNHAAWLITNKPSTVTDPEAAMHLLKELISGIQSMRTQVRD